ncbi:MAG TPA: glycosyltransferase, partial [Acidobacteriota bacterium]|nr:glycosyltransferase [Acidobacteriota bacterium]
AMACGLPSLGTHAASIPEVIGEAGRTFSPADSDDFARQALTLLEDDAAYLEAVQAGLRQVQLYSRRSLDDHLALALTQALQSGLG